MLLRELITQRLLGWLELRTWEDFDVGSGKCVHQLRIYSDLICGGVSEL